MELQLILAEEFFTPGNGSEVLEGSRIKAEWGIRGEKVKDRAEYLIEACIVCGQGLCYGESIRVKVIE